MSDHLNQTTFTIIFYSRSTVLFTIVSYKSKYRDFITKNLCYWQFKLPVSWHWNKVRFLVFGLVTLFTYSAFFKKKPSELKWKKTTSNCKWALTTDSVLTVFKKNIFMNYRLTNNLSHTFWQSDGAARSHWIRYGVDVMCADIVLNKTLTPVWLHWWLLWPTFWLVRSPKKLDT